jgi:hypothetical protein
VSATRRLDALCARFEAVARAIGIANVSEQSHRLRALCAPNAWAQRTVDQPLLASGLGHRTPTGLSVVCGEGAPELRVFLEAQAEVDDADRYFDIGRRLVDFVDTQPGTDISSFGRIAETLRPGPRSPFRIWFAVAFGAHGPPRHRVYLSTRGRPEETRQAAVALGRGAALQQLRARCTEMGGAIGATAEETVLCVHLEHEGPVKLYTLHPAIDRGRLRSRLLVNDSPGWETFLEAYDAKERWLVGHTLASGSPPTYDEAIERVALHRSLDEGDHQPRLVRIATDLGIDPSPYVALAALDLVHHFVSLQHFDRRPRLTVYMRPSV